MAYPNLMSRASSQDGQCPTMIPEAIRPTQLVRVSYRYGRSGSACIPQELRQFGKQVGVSAFARGISTARCVETIHVPRRHVNMTLLFVVPDADIQIGRAHV